MRLLFWVSSAFLESLFGVFEASWGAFWASRGSLGSLWEPLGEILDLLGVKLGGLGATFGVSWGDLGAILGHLEAKLGGLGATSGALRFFHNFWNHFGSKKGPQREAFWKPKRSKNRSKSEVQIEEQKSRLLESSWCDFGSISKRSWGQKY